MGNPGFVAGVTHQPRFFFSGRGRHTRSYGDWSSDVCSSDLAPAGHAHAIRPGVRPDRVGVTGWCWGGSTVYQVAATNADIKAAVAWYGPPARPYPDAPNPVKIGRASCRERVDRHRGATCMHD